MTFSKTIYKLMACVLLLITSQSKTYSQVNAAFSATPLTGCEPIRVFFTDISTGNPTAWKWDLGNSTISTIQNPSTTYFSSGIYTVKLTVYNGADSSTITKTNYITVYPNPIVNFNANRTSGCFPLNVQFQDFSNPVGGSITTWQWDFGDGNTSSLQNPTHTYTAGGNFNVSLTVTTANGCVKTLTRPNYININEGVHADFFIGFFPSCTVPITVAFTNISTGNINSYNWNFGDGGTSTLQNPSHTFAVSGLYTVQLIITSPSGCTDTVRKVGAVSAGIVSANFTAPAVLCRNTAINIQNTSVPLNNITSCFWDFGDGTTSNAISPTKSWAAAGTYAIKLVSTFGACKDSITKSITIITGPAPSFTGSNLIACRPPLLASFTNTTPSGTVVLWNFGDGTTSTQPNPTHNYTANGFYAVTLTVINSNGCKDSLRIADFVKIGPPKITRINPLPAKGCIPYDIHFLPIINTLEPIVSYEWIFGDGGTSTLPDPTHTYAIEGSYTVRLKVTSAGGCTDTISYVGGVLVGQKPMANFSATPRIGCAQDMIQFTNLSTGGATMFQWLFGDGGTSNLQNPSYNYNDTGYFNVKLIATRSGCADTLTLPRYIYIKPPISSFKDSFDCGNQHVHYFINNSIGAVFYQWYFGDGDSSNAFAPIHNYADTGQYNVVLIVRGDSGCVHMSTQIVRVLEEHVGFTITDSLGCGSTVKQFFATTHPWAIGSYLWNFGDGTSMLDSLTPSIHHPYDTSGTYQVQLTITDLNNCKDSLTIPTIVSKFGPTAAFGGFQQKCVNTLVTFSDSSTINGNAAIVSWKWDFGDGTGLQTFNGPPFVHQYISGGLFDVKLIVQDAGGCTDTLIKQANIRINAPMANFTSTDSIKCRNAPIYFAPTGTTGSPVSYLWNFGDGGTTPFSTPVHLYNTNGIYNVSLLITDSLGCSNVITKPQFIVITDALASFALSDSFTTCPPLFVTITNQSANNLQNLWDFGDGNTSTLLNPSHTYTFSGVFDVKLIVTGNGGCKDSATKQIKILGPSGSFSYTPIRGCTPMMVDFTANAQNTAFYTWDFNDGSTTLSTTNNLTHPYILLGTYLPKVLLEDSLGCKLPLFGVDSIRVKGIKTFIKEQPISLFCDSVTLAFTDSTFTNDTLQTIEWNFGDGTTSNLANPMHSYTTPGLYSITLKQTTITGCISMDTINKPIKVVASPITDIAGDTVGCTPKRIMYSGVWLNQDTSTIRWQWDLGNGQTSTLQNPPEQLYTTPGNYLIKSIVKNSSGCVDSTQKLLKIFPLPVVDAGAGNFICSGQSQALIATGAANYQWDSEPTLSCLNCANPIASPLVNTRYRVTGTDSNNCKNADTVLVKVKQKFTTQAGPGDTLCSGQSFKLRAFGAEKYVWQPPTFLNNNTIANPISKPDTTITYMVIGYDTLSCFKDTAFVTLKVYPIPTVNIVEDNITLPAGSNLQLNSTASAGVTKLIWTPPTYLNCATCPNPITTPKTNITYTLTASNDGNCQAQDRVSIFLVCSDNNVFIPNTFSPNGDGINDVFYPRGKGIFSIKAMRIFNRWGELMYEKTNFEPNDASAGWNGTYKGQKLSPDVFVYTIDAICDNNKDFNFKGNVTLLK